MSSRSRALLVLGAAIGCLHGSPNEAVLAPLRDAYGNGFADDSIQPQYLAFADPLTESVLNHIARSGRYRIVPAESALTCPSDPEEGMHGYTLIVRVELLKADTAVAALEQRCLLNGRSLSTGVRYLLARRRGKWQIEKPLDGWNTILGMLTSEH